MESHTAGGSQGGQDGREDADEGLQDELPQRLLGIATQRGDRLHIRQDRHLRVRYYVVNRLVDGLFNKLGQKLLK